MTFKYLKICLMVEGFRLRSVRCQLSDLTHGVLPDRSNIKHLAVEQISACEGTREFGVFRVQVGGRRLPKRKGKTNGVGGLYDNKQGLRRRAGHHAVVRRKQGSRRRVAKGQQLAGTLTSA